MITSIRPKDQELKKVSMCVSFNHSWLDIFQNKVFSHICLPSHYDSQLFVKHNCPKNALGE